SRGAAWGQTLLAAAGTPERKDIARREMQAALRPDVFDRLLPALTGPHTPPAAVVTLGALFPLDPRVAGLAAEPNKRRRRALVELVTAAARIRPAALVRRLGDPRWFLVRNLVDALAHSGRPEAAAGIRAVCSHADHRVRREARRALPLLDPAEGRAAAIEGLHDPNPALRLQALGLLRTAPGPEVEAALAAFIASRPPNDEAAAAVEVLAGRRTPQADAALRRLARPRLSLSASAREARRAAHRAMDGGRR
ncbi:MAG: hypothetical protein H6Q11_106, partial [Acidobacteria bacterium]|nr:hypothetical protein [Acidobacteriota bacterium]